MWHNFGRSWLGGARQQIPFGKLRAGSRPPFGRVRTDMGVIAPVIALSMLMVGLPLSAQSQKPANVNAELPAGAMQAKATTACTECHEARIILQQRLNKGAWTKEVDKMMKWGAVVDGADRDALIDYLSVNFSPDKPAYEASKTLERNGKESK